MSEFNVSTRYANSLIELAEEKDNLPEIASDIRVVYDTLADSKELQRILKNPIIKLDKKNSILSELFTSKISVSTLNFLKFILNKRREELLFDITKRFLELHDEKFGIVNATVISAVELSEENKVYVKEQLEKFTNKKIRTEYKLDKNVIGGFLVRIGDTILDATIEHQLENLKKKFKFGNISYN